MNGLPQQNAIEMVKDGNTETLVLKQKGADGKSHIIEVRIENIPNFIAALSKERIAKKKRAYAQRKDQSAVVKTINA